MGVEVTIVLARAKGSIFFWNKKEGRGLGRFRRNNSSGFQVFFHKGFACLHLRRVERIDFGNFGNEVGVQFDGVIIGAMRGELVMSFLGEDVCEVFAPIGYGWLDRFRCLGNLGRDGCLMDLFSIQPGLSFV